MILFSVPSACIVTSSSCLRRLDSHAHPPDREPTSRTGRWVPLLSMRDKYPEYTTKPLPIDRFGGRGPNGMY